MSAKRSLTVSDCIFFSGALVKTLFTLLKTIVTAGFRGNDGACTYPKHVLFAALREFTSAISSRGLMTSLTPTTSETYSAFVRKKGIEPDIANVGDTVGCWLGDSSADVVVVWFHGGAYVGWITSVLLDVLWDIILKGRLANKNIAVFIPQYDMAPQSTYPQQLIQGVAALHKILVDLKRSPSEVILAGDSAGGNLALGVLSHIMHPQPNIPMQLKMHSTFRGLVLVSPWVTFDQTAPAFERNKNKDVLSGPALKVFSGFFMSGAARQEYNHPLDADPSWWRDLPADSILLLAGEDELFVDDIRAFGDKIKVHNCPQTEELYAKDESHDQPLIDYVAGSTHGTQTKRLSDWIVEKA